MLAAPTYTTITSGKTAVTITSPSAYYSGRSLRLAAQDSIGSFGGTGWGPAVPTIFGARIDLESGNYGPTGTATFSRILFYTGGSSSNARVATMNLDYVGNLTTFGDVTAFSDKRLKTNIVPIENSLSTINQLTGVYYNRIDTLSNSSSNRHIGFIAQDVEAVLPEVVHTGSDEEKTKSLAYGNITALLLEGIKELSAKYDALKQEFDSLKNQLKTN
jgi:hypothetical protein